MALLLPDASVLIHALLADSAEQDSCRLAAGTRHSGIFSDFVTALGLCGNDINDVWLAALAIEHRATLVSTDQGFARFPCLSWINPENPL